MALSYLDIQQLKKIARQFAIAEGEITHVIPVDGGRINTTFKITVTQKNDTVSYMLQRINTKVFSDINAVMSNALLVTEHLRRKDIQTLEFVPVCSGGYIYEDYRMTKFIHAEIFQTITRPRDMYNLGYAVGVFAKGLSDFDVNRIVDTIPNFHNTKVRFNDLLMSAINYCYKNRDKGSIERVGYSYEEICTANKYHDLYGVIVDAIDHGDIPMRVTHNDTKLNNVLFDRKTNTPRCLIDLDTVMKGSVLYDIADAIRSGANISTEDERNVFKSLIDLELVREFLKGFKDGAPNLLTKKEIELIPIAIQILPLELGIRYLTDYLNGDVYFHIVNSEDNHNRAKIQFALAEDIKRKMDDISRIVKEVFD